MTEFFRKKVLEWIQDDLETIKWCVDRIDFHRTQLEEHRGYLREHDALTGRQMVNKPDNVNGYQDEEKQFDS